MCSRPLYISKEDRIPDPYRAYILEPYFWWETIEFEFKEHDFGVGDVAYLPDLLSELRISAF